MALAQNLLNSFIDDLGLLQLACGLFWFRRWWRLTRRAKAEF